MGKLISTLLFQPPDYPTPLDTRKYFWLSTSVGNKIPAFFIEQPQARFTVLYSHGNAEDLGMIHGSLVELSRLLYVNILAYDYSGYGHGKRRRTNVEKNVEPSEDNCYRDIEAAYDYLTKEKLISTKQIILYGRSVGSGPSCYLAQKIARTNSNVDIAGMVLHSPFLSVCRVVLDAGIENSFDIFPNVSRIRDITCPTYIMHGTNDVIVPFYHGKDLFDTLPEGSKYAPFWAENMGHNNIETDMCAQYVKRLQKFFLHLIKVRKMPVKKRMDPVLLVSKTELKRSEAAPSRSRNSTSYGVAQTSNASAIISDLEATKQVSTPSKPKARLMEFESEKPVLCPEDRLPANSTTPSRVSSLYHSTERQPANYYTNTRRTQSEVVKNDFKEI